jgi:hypothetical protein
MNWSMIDNQDDLNDLDQMICWEDSDVIEIYALNHDETCFPTGISRSGYTNKNLHVFCEVCSSISPYLYMVWIHCDCYDFGFVENLHMAGHVDSLKRVEIRDSNGEVQMRCARLIYRFVSEIEVNRDQPYLAEQLARASG